MSTEEPPELGITDEDRRKMAEWASRDTSVFSTQNAGRPPSDRRPTPFTTGEPPALPCECGPGIKNIMDTVSRLDYECPTCGATFTREQVDAFRS